ncbi:hypothetical protein RRG08_003679 [Elysia crispata]|uniref:FHA domain-containing protein n=1 Tax=Elysia crispata TaxID=231223 RepID=A0AAE1AV77_9GAST|nr:hypothetical protein RRG08_003679 [Elysia crispata]
MTRGQCLAGSGESKRGGKEAANPGTRELVLDLGRQWMYDSHCSCHSQDNQLQDKLKLLRHNFDSSKDPVNSTRVVPVGEREADMVDDNFGLGGVQFLGGAQSHGGLNGGGREDGVRGLGRQSGVTKPSHNYGTTSGTSHWRSHIPKQLYFSGEEVIQGEWKSYTFQLEMYIENMDLGPQDCKRLLFYTLRGRALNYAVSMEESNPNISLRDLMRQMKNRMKNRFGAEIRCEIAYLRLQNAVQERKEILYEWADRLCDLARKAVTSGQGSPQVLNVMVPRQVEVIKVLMDQDDFDQTQAIAFDDQDLDDDTDDLAPDGDKKPASFLKIPLQKGLNETSYPLYEGDNIIGRSQDTCHIHIASKSLSKEHACIQIVGDVHMIFDKSSRNKTRRGKLFLSPEVRYELKNNEEITFADVKCIYQIASEIDTVAESGSETEGSESLMLKYDVTNETSVEDTQNKGNLSGADAENNNDDSVLPPTQVKKLFMHL